VPGHQTRPTTESLRAIALLDTLPAPEIADLASRATVARLDAGAVAFAEGAPPDWLFIVAEGLVKLVKHSQDGRDVLLHLAGPGELVGGVAAFGRRPHTYTAESLGTSTLVRIAGRDFAGLMERYPAVAARTVETLVERLTEAHDAMKSLATDRVERRIARQLLKLAARFGQRSSGGLTIDLALTRQDVGDLAGTTLETAIRVLSRWQKAGLVRTVERRLVLTDLAALQEVAEM
jgi:CRP/FNR family transcriptional regulator